MAAARQVQIEVTGKVDQYESALKDAEAKTRDLMAKIEDTGKTSTGGGKGIGQYFKLGEGLENLAKGLISIEALKGAVQGVSGVVRALHGDFEGVEQTIRSLPLGLGGILGAMIDIGKAATGYKESLQASEEIAKSIEDRKKRLLDLDKQTESFGGGAEANKQGNARARAVEQDGEIGGIEFDRQAESAKVTQRARELIDQVERNSTVGTFTRNIRIANIKAALPEQHEAINEKYDRMIKQAQEKAAAQEAATKQKAQEEELAKEEAFQKRLTELKDSNAVERARAAGDDLQAELLAIDGKYRGMLDKARDGERQLLEEARGMEIKRAEALAAEREKQRNVKDQAEQNRIKEQQASKLRDDIMAVASQRLDPSDAGMLTRGLGNDRTDEMADATAKNTEETARLLREMVQEQKNQRINRSTQTVGFN